MPPLNLNDAAEIKALIVDPVVEGVESRLGARIASLEASDHRQQADIDALKRNQKRAMLGYSGIVVVVSVAFNAATGWVKKKLGWE